MSERYEATTEHPRGVANPNLDLTHTIKITLDPQRGGYLASCACGWVAKRPTFYKARAKLFAAEHTGVK